MTHAASSALRNSILLVIGLFCAGTLNSLAQADTAATAALEAATPAELFAEANANYAAGHFTVAAEQFGKLAQDAPALAVYYNLGNAHFRLGQYGRAIAAYQKALALDPAQPEVLANLDAAREAARVSPPPVTHWQHYACKLTPNTWTILLTISFWSVLGLWLIPAQFRRRYGIWRPALLALALVVFLLCAVGLYPWRQMSRAGTVLGADTPLLLAPVASSPVQSYAQAGQSAQWLGSHGQFDRIRLPDGSEGWVAAASLSTTWDLRR